VALLNKSKVDKGFVVLPFETHFALNLKLSSQALGGVRMLSCKRRLRLYLKIVVKDMEPTGSFVEQ
jgi:hypothetical protein